ncbi:MAG: thiamine pyrophosphate-dependent dehydrogenase E1 component subunit alpha [Bacteroidetes bacterium]|nr:thiamine pyrophosphate-dependent dehydrogenase E1 component subunit alpha [Bacteroidota bacterium]
MENDKKILLLRKMIKIRSFEEKVAEYKMDNKIKGPVHTRIGEEAIDVGVCSALSPQDYFLGTWRSHGYMIARGANINSLMAEIFGKITGFNGGKGGSMHVCDSSIGSLGASAIVGSGFGIACGAAFASLYKNDGKISCIFFGDGASNEGTFSECLNLASTWKLPLIFLLENNGFAITTPLVQASVSQDLFHRAEPFGISSKQIDGQNVEEIYNNVKLAITHIKEGKGPVLLEAKTFRFQEHQEGAYYAKLADVGYRDKHLVDYWKENKDPIKLFSKKLLAENIITTDELDRITKEEKHCVDNAIRYAETSPFPSEEEAYRKVFI